MLNTLFSHLVTALFYRFWSRGTKRRTHREATFVMGRDMTLRWLVLLRVLRCDGRWWQSRWGGRGRVLMVVSLGGRSLLRLPRAFRRRFASAERCPRYGQLGCGGGSNAPSMLPSEKSLGESGTGAWHGRQAVAAAVPMHRLLLVSSPPGQSYPAAARRCCGLGVHCRASRKGRQLGYRRREQRVGRASRIRRRLGDGRRQRGAAA